MSHTSPGAAARARPPRRSARWLVGWSLVCALAGCSAGTDPGTSGAAPAPGEPSASSSPPAAVTTSAVIGLVAPPASAMRHEAFDRRMFARAVDAACGGCRVRSYAAERDGSGAAEQLATAVAAGARVVVLDAVAPFAVAEAVRSAQEAGVKVIGYDTLLEDLDAYVGFDRAAEGRLQARAVLAAAPGDDGQVVLLDGALNDPVAAQVAAGAHAVLDRSGRTLAGEYAVDPERPRATRTWLATLLAFHPAGTIGGIVAGDDALAALALQQLRATGTATPELPPVAGAGASLAGVRRVVTGDQLMTTYRPVPVAVRVAARIAAALATGADPGAPTGRTQGVPTYVLQPVPVTRATVRSTVVADGVWTARQVCVPGIRADCRRLGIR